MKIDTPTQQPRTLDAWLSYLEKIHPTEIELGLERVKKVALKMGVLHLDAKIVLVGGTNGKGSTIAFLQSILMASGYQVGCYTSPHLVDYKERVLVQGTMLTEAEHCAAFEAVNQARAEISLTYFEFGTLAALWLLKQYKLEVILLEIGLGGRLDAVNIVEPDLSIVTSVAIDHVDFLGDDREVIGFEKAGIYRADKAAICGDQAPPNSLLKQAASVGARLLRVGLDYQIIENPSTALQSTGITWQLVPLSEAGKAVLPLLQNLPSSHLSIDNAANAIVGLYAAGFELDKLALDKGLIQASLPGRFEVWKADLNQPMIVIDVAHNPQAAERLAKKLQALQAEQPQPNKMIAVCGMLKDKDIESTLKPLVEVVDVWYFASLLTTRGLTAEDLAKRAPLEQVKGLKPKLYPQVESAFNAAKNDATANDVIVCFGSFVTVGAVYQAAGKK